MLKIRLLGATVVALAAASSPAAHAANFLVNGNFEAGPTGPSAPGWVIEDATNSLPPANPNSVLVLTGNDYIPCCGAGGSVAALANKFASFGAGDSLNDPNRIQQSYTTTQGRKRLTFDYGSIGAPGTHSLTAGVYNLVTNSFVQISTVTATQSNNFDTLFTTYTVDFSSAAGFENIQFVSFDGTASKDVFLDNVSISAVPEPASWALMITGFGLVGGAMRRRQAVRVTYA